MLEQLFGIRYTGSVDGNVYGYTLTYQGGKSYQANVFLITPTGDKPFGTYTVPTFGHGPAVKAIMAHDLYV